ncbi:Ig-like domain-containing protein [Pelomonas sp. BJYL3]|uniref:Ig-like domain-containing protein n=1 Tax=Pelomonas sp. BJYL3 TaxID=2976697 RepID=UPI0022B45F52|nr:Ig-like domain-containing protein [Pelomonas sp. BJYL3]
MNSFRQNSLDARQAAAPARPLQPWQAGFALRKGAVVVAAALALGTPGLQQAQAAELVLADGVVVKFGPEGQLLVRDKLTVTSSALLTSLKDDTQAGQTLPTPGTAQAGDWLGVRVERSGTGSVLSGLAIRHAGRSSAAALLLRGGNPTINYLQLSDNVLGLMLVEGAAPVLSGASVMRNTVGIRASGAGAASVANSMFAGQSQWAIENLSPEQVLQARNNWWGHASGPREATGNPAGQGDAVTAGVSYGGFLSSLPLINPRVSLVQAAPYFTTNTVQLLLSCQNASEYRVAEGGAFSGVNFKPLEGGRAEIPMTLSEAAGRKSISVQFRDANGNMADASLAGDVIVDRTPPQITLLNPANAAVIDQPILVQATASDDFRIDRVQVFIDNNPVATLASPPYNWRWDNSSAPEGAHTIKVVATDGAGRTAEQAATVTLSRTPPPADVEGPVLSNLLLGGKPLVDNMVVDRSMTLTLSASDRSGVAQTLLIVDGQMVGSASGANPVLQLNIADLSNGPHNLQLQTSDSLGNRSTKNVLISVGHAAPVTPGISSPAAGLVTRSADLAVSGTAPAGSRVQLLLDGLAVGGALVVGSDGRFASTVRLQPGNNLLQAQASDAYGDSPLSAGITIKLDTSVPSSPSNLVANPQPAGQIKLSWTKSLDAGLKGYEVYRSASPFTDIGQATKVHSGVLGAPALDDLPPSDGTWHYRVVAVNQAGTPSLPSNLISALSDNTPPRLVSLNYLPRGKVDAATGRVGQGRVDVKAQFSEALQSLPYLALVPAGGAPLAIELTRVDELNYSGSVFVDANTPSGTATTLLSARDGVGNRGTTVESGGSLKIDTAGPQLNSLQLNPAQPVRNEGGSPVQVQLGFSKAPAAVPQLRYLLSGPLRQSVPVTGLVKVDATTYQASFNLPSDAGAGAPETLSFSFQASDELDNVSTRVNAPNRFQVYQGSLPAPNVPLGFSAKAAPGGKVQLAWQAVDEATVYQLYRQSPDQGALQPLDRTSGQSFVDQTSKDGLHRYAVAAVRQANGQESVSAQSNVLDVLASANAPGAPQNLGLKLTGQGIYASWQAPLASTVDYYQLYRSTGTTITSVAGLKPIKTRVKSTQTYDPNPSPTEAAYVVTAVDAAGNESVVSNSAYLNASLLPVRSLRVEQLGSQLPRLSWSAPNGSVAGYLVYLGNEDKKFKLTPSPINSLSLVDTAFTAGERQYQVATVDSSAVELPRSVTLPDVNLMLTGGLPLKRGVMNRVQAQVFSASPLNNARVVLRLPINKDGTEFKEHRSEPFDLPAGQTRLVPVVAGGYADMPGTVPAQLGVEVAAQEDELVKVSRDQTLSVIDGALTVGMATEEFVRGGEGKIKLEFENTSDVEVELLTATAGGNAPSSELRFKIIDADGNVLATQPYKQSLGANVITLPNGQTVARIAAGSRYTSDVFKLNVPASSPNSIRVVLEVDKLRYHTGREDAVEIASQGAERRVSLMDTAYTGEVSAVTPLSSFGEQDVLISGRALARDGSSPMANSRLKLILNQQGFERSFSVLTDAAGNFSYTFKPTATDSGVYKVSAVHPDITDRPEQKSFTIQRVSFGPTPFRLDVAKNYPFTLPFTVKAGPGTSASNVRLVLNPADQPTGSIPAGIQVELPPAINVGEKQTLNLPVRFKAAPEAQPSGSLIFQAYSDERPGAPIGVLTVNYTLSEARPYLSPSPAYVETGLGQGETQIESLVLKNGGLETAQQLKFSLSKADGVTPAPSWISIVSSVDGDLPVGESRTVDLRVAPPAGTPEDVYEFRLNYQGDNLPKQSVNVYVSLTQSGKGQVLFKASDLFTATTGKDGKLIAGLAGATVTLQNEDVVTVTRDLNTDALGEALFTDLPAGRYKFRARAPNHQEVAGRLVLKPGLTLNQPVFLNYNLVTVEWSVREITIQDRYEITLNTTFETDVQAAVLVLQPASINLPKMGPGEVFYGELTLTNHGLIRADKLRQTLPRTDAFFRYEFLTELPSSLAPKQRITIPYRVVALQSLESATASGAANGGGCHSYSNGTDLEFEFLCKNGVLSLGKAMAGWFSSSSSTCPANVGGGTSGGSGSVSGTAGYVTSGSTGAVPPGTKMKLKGMKCVGIARGGGCEK